MAKAWIMLGTVLLRLYGYRTRDIARLAKSRICYGYGSGYKNIGL